MCIACIPNKTVAHAQCPAAMIRTRESRHGNAIRATTSVIAVYALVTYLKRKLKYIEDIYIADQFVEGK